MRIRLLLLVAFSVFFTNVSFAQIVGTDVFLQGQWLEIGVDVMGAFGTCSSPATYHAHPACGCTTTCTTTAADMDASYDWGHDGWATGTPCLMGPYTQPGYPQEGWGIQVGATEYRNWAGGGLCTGSFTIPGGITGYTNTGGSAIGTFTGNVAGLHIVQDSRVDTFASWVVVTTRFYNTTAAAITGVYYERTCDPDNASDWGGGSTTENVIVHQNEDARHDVEIGTYANSGIFNMTNSWMALATKDCRAKCGVLGGLSPGNTPAQLWAGTGPVLTTFNDSNYMDEGIFLVFNIGTIAPAGSPGDSAVVSYAYVYNGRGGIDSALPDPQLVVDGTPIPTATPPASTIDTFLVCSYPGITSVPLSIINGTTGGWTWGQWTWAPATGLSTTTGVTNSVDLTALTGPTTYTITGTDTSAGTMVDCNVRVYILTIIPCHSAYSNYPCVGNALFFGMTGDSTGASYVWTGPGGYTSYTHDPVIFPSSWADTGTFYVTRTIGTYIVTDSVHVNLHPLPVVSPSSSIPLCGDLTSPLLLTCNLDDAGETFSWIGPYGFTSTLQNPTINPFDSSLAGTYIVTGTSVYGCVNSAPVNVYPGVQTVFTPWSIHRGCNFDTVYFNNSTFNADVYKWSFGDGDSATIRDVGMHVYTAPALSVYTVTLTGSNPHCTMPYPLTIDLRHSVKASFLPMRDTFCLGYAPVFVNNSSTSIGDPTNPPTTPSDTMTFTSAWSFGNGDIDDSDRQPSTYIYPACGEWNAKLVVTDSLGCTSADSVPVYVVQLPQSSFSDTTLCISQPLALHINSQPCPIGFDPLKQLINFVWTQNMPNLSDSSINNPNVLFGIGLFVDTLTMSYPNIIGPGGVYGCAIRDTVSVNAVAGRRITDMTASATIAYGSTIQLNADNEVVYTWKPDDGTLSNPNINDPIASPSVTTTYTVYGLDTNGCIDSANVTIHVDSSFTEDMPSGFTPNNDGLNDLFRLPQSGDKYAKLVEFRVYNRWGELVFNTNNKSVGWDGTYHGVPQDMGVYFYEIIVGTPGGEDITYKGSVTLIR